MERDTRWLYDGTRKTKLSVRSDPRFPQMFRVHYPDGEVSDMANLSRACDAGLRWAARNIASTQNARQLSWKRTAETVVSSAARSLKP